MDLGLKDKVAVVTGGAKGIGEAVVRSFVAEEGKVVIVDRDRTAGERLRATLETDLGANRVEFVGADLSDRDACRESIERSVALFGRIDVVVNNAGFNDGVGLDADPVLFAESVDRNLTHVFTITHHALPFLRRSRGCVVNVGSKVAVTGQGSTSGYAAAKGAIAALTREWAIGLADASIRVNCVLPAECDTDQYAQWLESLPDPATTRRSIERLIPLGRRFTTPTEVADTVVFLASARASHITGQWVFVDGGYTHLDRAASHDHDKW